MWRATWLCSLCLALSGYCSAEFIEKLAIESPAKVETVTNCKLYVNAGVFTGKSPEETCAKYLNGVPRNGKCYFPSTNSEASLFCDAPKITGTCEDSFAVFYPKHQKCFKCDDAINWSLNDSAPPSTPTCVKTTPDEDKNFCKQLADDGDVDVSTTQGGCYWRAGLPTMKGCFFVYDPKIILWPDGSNIVLTQEGIVNTGVMCTLDKEAEKPKDPAKEPQSQEDCRKGQKFYPNAIDGKNICLNDDGSHDNGKSDEGAPGDGGKGDGNNGESSGGKGEASGGNGEGGNGDGGNCPAWAKDICGAFGWDAGKPDSVDTSNLPSNGGSGAGGGSIDIGQWDSSDKFMGSGSCPAPKVIEFEIANHVSRFELTYEPICQFVSLVRYVLLIIAMVVAARIVFSTKT